MRSAYAQPPIHPYYFMLEKNLQALWDNQQQLKQQVEEQILAIEQEKIYLKERA